MKNLSIVLFAVAALTSVGCKKKGGAGEAMAKMTDFKDKMCACKDKACADKVQEEMNKWSADNAKNAGDSKDKPDEKTMKEMQDVGTKYGECMAKAMGGGGDMAGSAAAGSAAPAGDGSAAACVEGAYKDPNNRYCLKLPDGFTKPDKLGDNKYDQSMDVFSTESNNTLDVKIFYKGDFESEKKEHSTEGNGVKILDKGDLPGGGYFVKAHRDDDKQTFFTALVKAGEKVIMCESMAQDADPIKPEDACKSIRGM